MPIPPAPYAFASIPSIDSRADRHCRQRTCGFAGARRGLSRIYAKRLAGDAGRAHDIRRARATDRAAAADLPAALDGACAPCAAVLAMLFKFYFLALAVALRGRRPLRAAADRAPALPATTVRCRSADGLSLPPHTEVASAPAWWALIFTLVADGTLFTSLLFGTLYLWISAPNWPAATTPADQASRSSLVTVAASSSRLPWRTRIVAGARGRRHAPRPGSASPRWRSSPPLRPT